MIVYNVQYTMKWKNIISTSLLQLFISWFNTSVDSGKDLKSQTLSLQSNRWLQPLDENYQVFCATCFSYPIIRGYILLWLLGG